MLLLLQQRVKIRKPLFWNSPHFPWEVTQEGDTTMCWSNLCASDKIQMSFLLRRNAKWKSTSCIFSSMPFSAPRPQESKLESRSESCFHWTNKSQKVRRSWLFLKILLTLASKTFVALWQLLMPLMDTLKRCHLISTQKLIWYWTAKYLVKSLQNRSFKHLKL